MSLHSLQETMPLSFIKDKDYEFVQLARNNAAVLWIMSLYIGKLFYHYWLLYGFRGSILSLVLYKGQGL